MSDEIKKTIKLFVKRILIKGIVIVTAVILILQYVLGFFYYRGNTMFPNIKDGDFVVTWKLEDAQTNDVVLYENPDGEMQLGRVVAKGGDEVKFTEDGELMINGSIPSEEVYYASTVPNGIITYPYKVSEGEYFILNDYRSGTNESYNDSRTYKSISKNNLKGRVILLFRRRGF